MSEATADYSPVMQRLKDCGVSKVCIIDDVYDPPSCTALGAELDDFWEAIKTDAEALDELQKLAPTLQSRTDFDDATLALLLERLDTLSKLQEPCARILFHDRTQQVANIDKLIAHLQELGIEVTKHGSNVNIEADCPEVQIVFLDYYMDRDSTRSEEIARAIYRTYSSSKPFIILMSNQATADAEGFKTRTQILGGLFQFISKDQFYRKQDVHIKLLSCGIGDQISKEISGFVGTLDSALNTIVSEFRRFMRALDAQDYALIQTLSLRADGHPFGDYLLWLFDSLLSHLFRSDATIQEQQKRLDRLAFKKHLPCHAQPSIRLGEIYRKALTEPTAYPTLSAHPLDETDSSPLLQTGDMFIRTAIESDDASASAEGKQDDEKSDVLLVINAACDLAFSPLSPERQCDPKQPIFLVPGKFVGFEQAKGDEPVTDVFEYKGKVYTIVWDVGHTFSVPLGQARTFFSTNKYSERARLRLPYALNIQREFTSKLMRVGMPVAPPLYRAADVELYSSNADKKYAFVAKIRHAALVIQAQGAAYFIMTVDGITALNQKLIEIAQNIEAEEATVPEGPHVESKKASIKKRAAQVRELGGNSTAWVLLLESLLVLPSAGKEVSVDKGHELHSLLKIIRIFRDHVGLTDSGVQANSPIAINLCVDQSQTSSQRKPAEPDSGAMIPGPVTD